MEAYNNSLSASELYHGMFSLGDLHEEVDMDIGSDLGTPKHHEQRFNLSSKLKTSSESKTEPINIDNARRRTSQRSFNDTEQVRQTIPAW